MNVLKGINVPVRYVGYARALLTAVVIGALEAAIHYLTNADIGGTTWPLVLPLIVFVLRSLETEVDHKQKPQQNATPAPGSVVKVAIDEKPIVTVPITPPADTTPPTSPAP